MRLGAGPVFAYERLIHSRRWQTYASRAVMVGALLIAMATIAFSYGGFGASARARRYAELGQYYFCALIGVELALVMLAAPAATAGAICLDRARGTLAHVMVTDLSDAEIVLGKLAARLEPVMGLVACTWPLMAISSLLGGIDPEALTLAFAIIVAVGLLGCAMALALSVWARRPHEVILTTYTFWIVLLLAWPVWFAFAWGGLISPPRRWLLVLDPFYLAFAPYAVPGRVGFWEYAGFFGVALGASVALVLLAVRRMRAVACRMAGAAEKGSRLGLIGRVRRWLPGPTLERDPVLWREWHRSRPSAWMTILAVILGGTTGLACAIGAFAMWRYGVGLFGASGPAEAAGVYGYILQVIFGLLMLSAVAPWSLSKERQRGSLDVLAATPLSTSAIMLGKWRGTLRWVPLLVIGPGLMALALATARWAPAAAPWINPTNDINLGYRICGAALIVLTVLVHAAALGSLGLALATWIKRQSRAIAMSVCAYVLVAAAWPLVMALVLPRNEGMLAQGLALLSPIVAVSAPVPALATLDEDLLLLLWWIGFWDVGVAAFAIGLLWLTCRTFDVCFGRIPERPRTSPVLADVLATLGGITAPCCLYIAITVWAHGINPHSLSPNEEAGIACHVALIMLGLLVLSAVAPMSPSTGPRLGSLDDSAYSRGLVRTMVLTRWWRIFRLVPLLALGPGLLALGSAAAPRTDKPADSWVVVSAKLPAGGQAPSGAVLKQAAPATKWSYAELPLGDRLVTAVLLVFMILAHGAAITSAGLALATWIKRRSLAIGASVAAFATVALAGPLYLAAFDSLSFRYPAIALETSALSPISSSGPLFARLITREPQLPGLGWWVAFWIGILSLLAAGLLRLTIGALERRASQVPISARPAESRVWRQTCPWALDQSLPTRG
jgi:ABC-type transport system involved in multi-copper enzyme maturation permease subunit